MNSAVSHFSEKICENILNNISTIYITHNVGVRAHSVIASLTPAERWRPGEKIISENTFSP